MQPSCLFAAILQTIRSVAGPEALSDLEKSFRDTNELEMKDQRRSPAGDSPAVSYLNLDMCSCGS